MGAPPVDLVPLVVVEQDKPMVPTTTATTRPSTPTATSNHNMRRRLQLIGIVTGLLIAEYTLQYIYYQHKEHRQQQQHKSMRVGIFGVSDVVVPKSTKFISQLELDTCHFPVFFDKSAFEFKLKNNLFVEPGNWRERSKQYVGKEDAQNVYKNLQKMARYRHTERQHNPDLPRVKRSITFVHIGKAGGSTVACSIRATRKYISDHCDNIDYDDIDSYDPETAKRPYIPESAISRHVNCYTHWRMHLKCFYLQGDNPFQGMRLDESTAYNFGSRLRKLSQHHSNNDNHERHGEKSMRKDKEERRKGNDYLINMRSPVDRIASWFVYEHTENHESGRLLSFMYSGLFW